MVKKTSVLVLLPGPFDRLRSKTVGPLLTILPHVSPSFLRKSLSLLPEQRPLHVSQLLDETRVGLGHLPPFLDAGQRLCWKDLKGIGT